MPSNVRVLFDDDVERFAKMSELIAVMKDILARQARNEFVSPPRHAVKFPPGNLVFTVGGTSEIAGFRVYNTFGRVPHTGTFIPSSNPDAAPEDRQIVAVWDLATNQMRGLVIGNHVSAYRAGSISGVAIDLLTPKATRICALLGTGHHATTQLMAATAVRSFETIRIYSRDAGNRARFVAKMSERLGRTIEACDSAEMAVRGADVVLCATNSATPVIDADWIAPNAYVSSLGPKFLKTTEMPATIGARAKTIVTDTPAQHEVFRDNHFLTGTSDFDRAQPLNAWLDRAKAPSRPGDGITLFMMTGLAGTEVITGSYLLDAAERHERLTRA
jgi:ornithine cyclodeaminase